MQTKTVLEAMNMISKLATELNHLEFLASYKKLTPRQNKERLRLRTLRAIVWNKVRK